MHSMGIGLSGFLLQLGRSSSLQWHCKLESGSVYRQDRPTRLDKIKNFHAALQAGGVVLGIATANDLLLDLTIGMKYVWQSWVRRLVSPLGAPEERSQHVQLDDALHRRGVPVRQAKLTPDGLEFSEDVSEAKWVEESLSDFGTVRAI